jgi:hypothetical protein
MIYKGLRIKSNYHYPDEPHYVPIISYDEYPTLLAAKRAITKYLKSNA